MASGADRLRSRRTGRRLALAALFEAEFGQRTPQAILERHLAETEGDPEAGELSRALVEAVVQHRDSIDTRIGELAPQYPVVQLARMDRALLRGAVGEVLHSPTPARVAIAEWVELARIYSGEPMRRLMNGVLGRIAPASSGPARQPSSNSEEGVSGQHVRPTEEARRRAARRRR
ncbi:MAG: transcription antitermination factor NusB [Chloroflexota bacterium]|nr:transcription antitermination factor NusB [Chloroflexota bacterium]